MAFSEADGAGWGRFGGRSGDDVGGGNGHEVVVGNCFSDAA